MSRIVSPSATRTVRGSPRIGRRRPDPTTGLPGAAANSRAATRIDATRTCTRSPFLGLPASSRINPASMFARGPIALLAGALLAAACAPPPEPPPVPVPLPEPPPAASLAPLPCDRIVRVEVHKSARTLRAFCERGTIVEMTAALGREPDGPKQLNGH